MGSHAGGGLKVRDVIRLIEQDGWFQVRQRGSHRQFKHLEKPGLVTIAGKPGNDLAAGTLDSVLKQAGLDEISGRS
jgi:predicted RNA binding protein YcfA (HicA-like mRNA interferase family)